MVECTVSGAALWFGLFRYQVNQPGGIVEEAVVVCVRPHDNGASGSSGEAVGGGGGDVAVERAGDVERRGG